MCPLEGRRTQKQVDGYPTWHNLVKMELETPHYSHVCGHLTTVPLYNNPSYLSSSLTKKNHSDKKTTTLFAIDPKILFSSDNFHLLFQYSEPRTVFWDTDHRIVPRVQW